MANATLKTLPWILVLAVASITAQSPTIEIRGTGEHAVVSGETPDVATQLAFAGALDDAIRTAVTGLQARADVKALELKPAQLEAYATALLDVETAPSPATAAARNVVRVQVRARLDAEGAARRMAGLRKDQDATYEVVAASSRIQQLQRQLADQTRRRATVAQAEAVTLAAEQLRGVTAMRVAQLAGRAYVALARTEPTTVGGRATAAGGREQASQLAAAALALAPDSPDAHYLMGDVWLESERLQEAEAEYRRALQANADDAAGRTKLAAALRLQGTLPEALSELREAQRLDPTFARAHSDLGMILRAQRNLPEAMAAYREAIRLDPDSTDAHNGLAVTFANSAKLEEAVAEFREIIRIDPDSTIGYYNLAYALADLDRDVESAAALREVIRINPDHYNARFNLGELFRLEGKYDDSANQFREYLRLAPDTPQNQRNITRAAGYVRQFEDPDAPAVAPAMRR